MTDFAPFSFPLGQPVATTGGPVAAIMVNKLPEVREIVQSGMPIDGAGEYDMPAIARLLADCSDAPEFVFDNMDAGDLFRLSMRFATLLSQGGTALPNLRRPTGADLINAGSPIDARGKWVPRNLVRLAIRLSGRDEEAILALPGRDFLAMAQDIAGFLAPNPKA